MTWGVVLFIEENLVEVVPKSWIAANSQCFWPSGHSRKRIIEAVKHNESPGCTWNIFQIKILGLYDDLLVAQLKCNKAKDRDNLSSSADELPLGKGLRAKKTTQFDDFDCNLVDYPIMPSVLTLQNEGSVTKPISKCSEKRNNISAKANSSVHKSQPTATYEIEDENWEKTLEGEMINGNKNKLNVETMLGEFIKETKEFERQVIRQLHILNARMKEIMENQEIFMKSKNNIATEHNEDHLRIVQEKMAIFPIQSEIDLLKLEEVLKDSSEMKILAKELSLLGGNSVKEITRRIMFQIMSNQIGQLYSWDGQKGKKKFRELLLPKLVINAVRLNDCTQNSTESDIIKPMREWLVRAKFRQQPVQPITERNEN